jgi:predicted  nucleic acid-binding Zn-ribbon protein
VLEELKVLVEIQGLDTKIHKIEKDKERLPRLLAIAGEDLQAAGKEEAAAKAEADSANKEKKEVDLTLQTENEHLRKLKLRSTDIKTNKEYFAHLKEIEDCQKKISGLEENTLLLMEKVEKADARLAEMKTKLKDEQAKFDENEVRIKKKFEGGEAELKVLVEKRDGLMKQLSAENAEYYRQILKLHPDSAVVEAGVDGSCGGCRMTISPQVFQNVRKGESIVTCYNCRRIMFFKEA